MQDKLTNNVVINREHEPRTACRGRRTTDDGPRSPGREHVAAERLEAGSRLSGWFAHQINNPLGAISGNAQLLMRRLQRDIKDAEALQDYMRYLEGIQAQTERCARITGEMLNFTQSSEPDLRALDVHEVIREAVDIVRYAHPDSPVAYESDDHQPLPAVRADREVLIRVLFELLSNAVEVSSGGIVRILAGVAASRKPKVQVQVQDSGPGISRDVLPRIFDPFFSTREKARGLGLTVGLELIQRMGGTLKVERTDGAGSVFTVGIPVW
jgi:two-component system, NtrC family, sensor kinase